MTTTISLTMTAPNATSLQLNWTIDGDTPSSITIMDECSGGSLSPSAGGQGKATLSNLPASTQYRIFLVGNYPGGVSVDSNLVDRYAGKPCAKPAAQPPVYPALTAQPYPKDLHNTNRIVVSCQNSNIYSKWIISVNGVQHPDEMSGSAIFEFASAPGQTFVLNGDGNLPSTGWTGWGPPVSVTAGKNSNSVREFLSNSGVDGTAGLWPLGIGSMSVNGSVSMRGMLGL